MRISVKRIKDILNRPNNKETRKNKKGGNRKYNRKRRRSSRTSKARNKKPNLRYSSLKNRKHKGGGKINPNNIGSDDESKRMMERYEQTALNAYVSGITEEMKKNPSDKATIKYIRSTLGMSLQEEITRLESQKAGENIVVSLISRVRGAYKDLDIKKVFIESLKGIVDREIEVANEGANFSGAYQSTTPEERGMRELKEMASNPDNNISAISTQVFDRFNFGIGSDAQLTLMIVNLELEVDELLKTLESEARRASARNQKVAEFINDPANKINEICEKLTLLFNYIDFYVTPGKGFLKYQGDEVVLGKQSGVQIENDTTNARYIDEQNTIFNMVKGSFRDRVSQIKINDNEVFDLPKNKNLTGGVVEIASVEFVPNTLARTARGRSPPSIPPIVIPDQADEEESDEGGLPTTAPVGQQRLRQPEAEGASSSTSELRSPAPAPPKELDPMLQDTDLFDLDRDSRQSRAFKAMPPEVQQRIIQEDTAERTLSELERKPPSKVSSSGFNNFDDNDSPRRGRTDQGIELQEMGSPKPVPKQDSADQGAKLQESAQTSSAPKPVPKQDSADEGTEMVDLSSPRQQQETTQTIPMPKPDSKQASADQGVELQDMSSPKQKKGKSVSFRNCDDATPCPPPQTCKDGICVTEQTIPSVEEVTGPPQPTVGPSDSATQDQQDIADKRRQQLEKMLKEKASPEDIQRLLSQYDDEDMAGFVPNQGEAINEDAQEAIYQARISILNSCFPGDYGGETWDGIQSYFNSDEARDIENTSPEDLRDAVYLCPLVKQQNEVFGQEVSGSQLQEGFGLQKISGSVAYCGFIGMLYYAVQVKARYSQFWESLGIPDDSELGKVIAWAERVPAGSNNVIDYANVTGGLEQLNKFLVFIRSQQNRTDFNDTYADDQDLPIFSRLMSSTVCVWESQQPVPYWEYYEGNDGGPPGIDTTNLLRSPPEVGIPPPCLLIHQDTPVNHYDYVNLADNAVVFQMMPSGYLGDLLQEMLTLNIKATGGDARRYARASRAFEPASPDPSVSEKADKGKETESSSTEQLPFGPESAFMCPSKFPHRGPQTAESMWVTENMNSCGPPEVLPNYFAVFNISADIWAGKQFVDKWSDNEAFNEYVDLINEYVENDTGTVSESRPNADGPSKEQQAIMKERMIRCAVPIQTKYGDNLGYLGVWTPAFKKLVNNRYKKLALKFHPDKNPNDRPKFDCILAAKKILTDEDKFYRYIKLWKTCAESSIEDAVQREPNAPSEINVWPPSWLPADKYKDFYQPNFVGLPGDTQYRKDGDPPPTPAELQGFSWSYKLDFYSNLWPAPPSAKPEDVSQSGGAVDAAGNNIKAIIDPVTQRTYFSYGGKTSWNDPRGGDPQRDPNAPDSSPVDGSDVLQPPPPPGVDLGQAYNNERYGDPADSDVPQPPPSSSPEGNDGVGVQTGEPTSQSSSPPSGPPEPMRGSMTQELQPDGNIKVNISLVVPPECAKRTTIATTGNSGGQTQGVLGNMISRINGVDTNPSSSPSAPPAIEGPSLQQLPPSQSDDALPQPPALPPPAVPQAEASEDDPVLQPDGSIIVGNRLLAPDPIPRPIMSSLDISRPVELNLDLINQLLSQPELPEEIRERLIAQQNEEMRNQGRPLALPASGGKRKNKKKKQTRKKRQKKKRTNNTRRSKGGHHPDYL